VHDIEMIV